MSDMTDIVLLLTPHETRHVRDALAMMYQNWIVDPDGPGTPQDKRAVECILSRITQAEISAENPPPRLPPRTRKVYPKCIDPQCGHSVRSHNELGYCQAGQCACDGCDDGKHRQPDGTWA